MRGSGRNCCPSKSDYTIAVSDTLRPCAIIQRRMHNLSLLFIPPEYLCKPISAYRLQSAKPIRKWYRSVPNSSTARVLKKETYAVEQKRLNEPIISGKSFHRAPLRSIHKISFSTWRVSCHNLPRSSSQHGGFGISGLMIAHCSSISSSLHVMRRILVWRRYL